MRCSVRHWKRHFRSVFSYRSDLIGEIWSDRPALSAEPVWILDSKYTGESAADRLAKVREKMKENGAEVHILTALDDIAWMLNIRGNDIPCNPVVLSYLILTETEGHLFIQEATLNDEVKQYLAGLGISIHPYDAVYDFAASITGKTILLESQSQLHDLPERHGRKHDCQCDEPGFFLKGSENTS